MADKDDISELVEDYQRKNEHIDFEEFFDYYKGELSEGTLVQNIRYLSALDFDPLSDKPQPGALSDDIEFELSDFKEWSREKARQKFGTADGDRNTRNRFEYFVYLALQKYLKAKDSSLLAELPSSEAFDKPHSAPQTVRYSEKQLQKMLDNTNSDKMNLAIKLMFYSGLRAYEVLHIKLTWFEFKEDRIEIEIPPEYAKGKRANPEPEYAFLKKDFEDEVKEYIQSIHDSEEDYSQLRAEIGDNEIEPRYLFNFIKGSSKSFSDLKSERYQINRLLKSVTKKAGINQADKISAHKLRKSFIHHIQNATGDLSQTSQLARHKDPSTTQRFYLQLDKKQQAKTYSDAFN